ncbi:hypothetical protein ACWD5B_25330, partial [Streptomyces tanashiensis]
PHKRFWEGDTGDDLARVDAALARVGLTDLADRAVPKCPGGVVSIRPGSRARRSEVVPDGATEVDLQRGRAAS